MRLLDLEHIQLGRFLLLETLDLPDQPAQLDQLVQQVFKV
jgi:hypothetical protein